MGVETFSFRQPNNILGALGQLLLIVLDYAYGLDKVIAGKRAGEFRPSSRWQSMTWPGPIVANCNRAVITDKYSTGVLDFVGDFSAFVSALNL